MKTTLSRFRYTALAEGVSFLVLLIVAMPLKYLADMPMPVKIVGWIHGILFVAYIFWLIACWMEYNWSFKKVLLLFLASLLPFGPFVADRKKSMKAEV
jgi:integral membrane protein